MAFIYRYQLKRISSREKLDLREYRNGINTVILSLFDSNLKDCFVEKSYFEFKLYTQASISTLQNMGRALREVLPFYGFVRMDQTLYALVHGPSSLEEDYHIELIDSIFIDDPEGFQKRYELYFEKYRKDENYNSQTDNNRKDENYNNQTDNYRNEAIKRNCYLDVIDIYVSNEMMPSKLKESNEITAFKIKGRYKNSRYNGINLFAIDNELIRESIRFENHYDYHYLSNIDNELINEIRPSNILQITESKKVEGIFEKVKEELYLDIPIATEIKLNQEALTDYSIFKVHNVGQALATSLSPQNGLPWIYFDYGLPFGKDIVTLPVDTVLDVNEEATILLSHTHKDHWYGVAYNKNSYKCHWYLPDQTKSILFNKKIAEIVNSGGSVNIINRDLAFPRAKITCGGISKINASRIASNKHETGLTFRIEGKDEFDNSTNILVAGDQSYDYIATSQLSDIDILVASHHGGSYCWSVAGNIPSPKVKYNGKLIYSCGINNRHKHPSKTSDYKTAGWMHEHNTSKQGEYKVVVKFRK